jgi:hypothetical protein
VETEFANQRSEFVNALLDLKAKIVELNVAKIIVMEMDSVMMGFVFAMMAIVEKNALLKNV